MLVDFDQDTISLPSEGIPYREKDIGLIDGSKITIRPFKLGDQRELVKAAKSGNIYQVYHKLLSKLVVTPNVDFDSLLMSDVIFILFAVKIKTYTTIMDANFVCEYCDQVCETTFDLNDLLCKYASEIKDYKTNLTFKQDDLVMHLHLPRLRDEKTTMTLIKDMEIKNSISDIDEDKAYMRKAVLIDSINEDALTPMGKFDALMNFSITEYEGMKAFIKDHETGIMQDSGKVECIHCHKVNSIVVALTPDFFRPAANGESVRAAN